MSTGTFFEVRPKVLFIMIIYMSLFYMTNLAFTLGATQDNTHFGYIGDTGVKYETEVPYENMTKEQKEAKQTEVAKKGFWEGGIVGLVVGTAIVIGVTIVTGGIGTIPAIGVVGSSTLIGGLGGIAYEEAKLEGLIQSTPLDVIFDLIIAFTDTVLNFLNTMASFLTFGLIKNANVPSIPYPFNLISFILVMPVLIVCTIWIIGLTIEAVRSIKIPFAG